MDARRARAEALPAFSAGRRRSVVIENGPVFLD